MKKIILFIIAGFMFILGACSSRNTSNEFDTFDKAVSNLDSYSLTANMTIYKFDKEINADIKVDYLKPDFYKVVFKTQNSNEQIIVKNKEGQVFVDLSGRANGRGAYLKKSKEALEIARKKKSLARALECEIPEALYQEIENIIG